MKKIISLIITLIVGFIVYYFTLPAINIHSFGFWFFIFFLIMLYTFLSFITLSINNIYLIFKKRKVNKMSKIIYILPLAVILTLGLILLINFTDSPILNSKAYYNRISVSNGNFTDDFAIADFNTLALLDKDSSSKLGDRVMGQMTDLVSQFYVSDMYTQINYNNEIIRVTPLEYSGLIKYFINHKSGVPGYITVNSVTGEANLVRLDKGIKYTPSAILNEDLYRKLRFSYPTLIFDSVSFVIDEEGNPYFIAPIIKYSKVGLRKDISGVVILDPITGDSKKYDISEVPSWVDHVYPSSLIIEQLDDWGSYKNGFLNSLFGQKGVVITTEGYNYIASNDDIYLYTGITSVVQDEANIGFVMTNLRTKETKFYNVAGAKEYSAMASAIGAVQQMSYTSTFPLIINLNGKPTYLMSLKDNAGLVKMYAFVDYQDYQKVVVTDANEGIKVAAKNYLGEDLNNDDINTLEIKVTAITSAVLDGTTYYYLKSNNDIYRASIKVSEDILPFIKVGDKIKITYKNSNEIIKIEE